MANSYYLIIDVSGKRTIGYTDRLYFGCSNSTNILRRVKGFIAGRNIDDLRIYRFETKRAYEDSYKTWVSSI